MAASINPIRRAEIFNRFFAIEKDKFDSLGQLRIQCQNPGELQEQTRAGSAVVRSNELKGIENLCVVMRAKQKHRLRTGAKSGDQIDEFHFATRSLIGKRLLSHLPAKRLELFLDVSSRSNNCVRTGRPGAEIHQRLNVSERFVA